MISILCSWQACVTELEAKQEAKVFQGLFESEIEERNPTHDKRTLASPATIQNLLFASDSCTKRLFASPDY